MPEHTHSQQPHIAIVGGGMLGLSLAYELSNTHRVTIFEAAPTLGGQTATMEIGDIRWDQYYHIIAPDDTHLRALLDELNLTHKLHWKPTKTGFYANGTLHELSNIMQFIRFPVLNLWEKFRLGTTILRAATIRNLKTYEAQTSLQWLTQHSGATVVKKMWEPLLKSKFGAQYATLSAAFIISTISRMFGARKGKNKQEVFGYIEGGYQTIISALEEALITRNVTIHTDAKVESITQQNGTICVTSNGIESHTSNLILTTAPALSARLCKQLSDAEKSAAAHMDYLGIHCVSLLLNKSVSPYYITNILDEDCPFTGIIEMSALVDTKEYGGKHLVYLPRYVASTDTSFEQDPKLLTQQYIDAFLNMYPSITTSDIHAVHFARTRYILAVPTSKLQSTPIQFETSLKNIYMANTSHIKEGVLTVNKMIGVAKQLKAILI